jgi:glutamate synthase domain-containing protein 1
VALYDGLRKTKTPFQESNHTMCGIVGIFDMRGGRAIDRGVLGA